MNSIKLITVIGLCVIVSRLVISQEDTSCICAQIDKKVCGTDGNVYENECKMDCANKGAPCKVVKVFEGSCNRTCVCPMDYTPVCGSDNKNYGNECALNCKALEIKNPCLQVAYYGTCKGAPGASDTAPRPAK